MQNFWREGRVLCHLRNPVIQTLNAILNNYQLVIPVASSTTMETCSCTLRVGPKAYYTPARLPTAKKTHLKSTSTANWVGWSGTRWNPIR